MFSDFLRVIGSASPLAWLISGGAVGFIFGIPRTLQEGPAPDASGRIGYEQRVNTNLEQISDWLTKILVGLGLTELKELPARLGGAARYLAACIGNCGEAFAFALIVYFSIAGFLGGYLLTRLFLQRLFYWADQLDRVRRTADEAKAAVGGQEALLSAYLDLGKKPPVTDAILEQHVKTLESLISTLPTSRMLHIVLGRLYRRLKMNQNAIDILTEFVGRKRAAGENDADVATALFNRACNRIEMARDKPEPERETFHQAALADLQEALRLDKTVKEDLSDTDLEPLRSDERFKALR